jgi:ABC-2 type transport system permease protein
MTAFIKDTHTLTFRILKQLSRNIDTMLTTVIIPIMMMLLFVFVFGGAISTGGDTQYIDYVVPGIILLSVGYCAGTTAVSVNDDMKKGVLRRFRTMPITRSSILFGHVFASVIRNIVATTIVLIVALIMGFRTSGSFYAWVGAIGILLLFTLGVTWLSVMFGLFAKSPEGAGTFSFFLLFLPYLSSAFVPITTMPNWMQGIAQHQPFTPINESIRGLLLGGAVDQYLLPAVLWCLGMIVFGYVGAMMLFSRKDQ